ncbi:2,4-dihydroxyhept-2-ene-1,7-dioic acid aldolase [Talaromyces islandicus]|uniref:2,4-dihydroxyhept-2-ene-1,7-dioic acid aldolase n=1 Tax=Talaromyces islandicus TaxID=28573 RepID=A0A0U1LT11_TALIS|nr:2,4-dihydroxyhept-2-ene-1,7-dioic acid aldolase [Talaromyces islandicus]
MPFDTAIRSALQKDSPAFGFWLCLNSAPAAKTFLRAGSQGASGGFSWVLVDAEHGLITDRDYYELNNAIASEGASPIIRVPWAEEWMIKRALDAGAHGVMTPMCHSEEDAAKIVRYSKYPPRGTRGYGPMFAPHAMPGVAAGEQHDAHADDSLIVAVQIESRSGVENVEKIAAVDGLDVLLIGPFDLAKQLGVTRGGEEHEAAIQRILKAAQSASKTAAIFCTDGNDARKRIEQGFTMVSIITDVGVLTEGMSRQLAVAAGNAQGGQKRDGY